jgi:YegS/Rv2252/BmrU family lipid kinase
MPASTVLIVNPKARNGWLRDRWPLIEPELRSALGPLDIRLTTRAGEGTALARAAALGGARLVIALGGDGTASEVASGLLLAQEQHASGEPMCSFAYLPCATGGDFRRSLGLPSELGEAARAVAASPGRLIDAGQIQYTGHDGRPRRGYFLNVASAGISGLIDHLANDGSKRLGGRATFLLASLQATLRYRNPRVRVRLDDQPSTEGRIYTLAVANGAYFGGGMHIAPAARLDDGVLDVITLGDLSLPELLRLGRSVYEGSHLDLPKVTASRARTVRVEACDPEHDTKVLLDVDGETPGRLPAQWSVLPGALHLRGFLAAAPATGPRPRASSGQDSGTSSR